MPRTIRIGKTPRLLGEEVVGDRRSPFRSFDDDQTTSASFHVGCRQIQSNGCAKRAVHGEEDERKYLRRRRHRLRPRRPHSRRAARQKRPQGLRHRTQSQRRRGRVGLQEGRADDRAGPAPDGRSARPDRSQACDPDRARHSRRDRMDSGAAVLFGEGRSGRRDVRNAGRVRRRASCAEPAVSEEPRGFGAVLRRARADPRRRRRGSTRPARTGASASSCAPAWR